MKSLKRAYISYIAGFALSLVFTLNAFIAVTSHEGPLDTPLIVLLVGLAIAQLVTQTLFFLHLGRETKPRWNSIAFLTMIMVVLFIVGGSIWIMNNLNYNMMGEHIDKVIIEDEGISR